MGLSQASTTGKKNQWSVKNVRDDSVKTIETRVLYADKGKDIWHEKQDAV